ncbi:MAG: dihydroorotate dehydrogenase, partial [Clostridiales bacterium]
LSVDLAKLHFKNPLIAASGTFGFGREFADIYDLSLLGGISVKGTTLYPRAGNPPPRIVETPAGMLNSVGLQNPGVEAVIAREIPFLRQYDLVRIVNIAGHDQDEYRQVAEKLFDIAGVDALEVNISCPNVKNGGMAFGTDPKIAAAVTKTVRQACSLPLIVKLSPNVTDISEIALAVESEGADAVSLINTVLGMAIDAKKRRPIMANVFGGLSGPALKPIALRMVWQVAQKVKIPIIGMGGINSAVDVIEFMLAGASAVQVGAGNFHNPFVCPEILEGLQEWLENEGVEDINQLVGALKMPK